MKIAGVLLVALLTATAPSTKHQFGLLFTKAPEVVKIGLPLNEQPDISAECTTKNWGTCNETCGGIAFGCVRTETWVYVGCVPMCQWHVFVSLTCTCP